MRCAGNAEIQTPVLDSLAARGIRFDNFFCVSPVCSPARASLLTGEIPSQHGVHDWIREGNVGPSGIDYLADRTLITDLLSRRGYRCGLVGKWHLGASDAPREGYVKWYAHQSGMSAYYKAPMVDGTQLCEGKGYLTDELAEIGMDFIRQEAERPEPFWLSLNFTAPHYPWIDSHPRQYTDLYENCPFESCPDERPHPWNAGGNPATDEGNNNRRQSLIGYYAAVSAMDAAIGRVLAELDRLELRQSTLVIFMSDNGMNCGHHGIWGKGNGTRPQNMYDTSVKVPCIMSQPGRIPEGLVNEDLLSGYDVFPTLLDYLGVAPRDDHPKPGCSFAGLLRGAPPTKDRAIYVFDEYGPVRMVRTQTWKYVHRHLNGPHELYDLAADPDERTNLMDNADFDDRAAALRGQLSEWFGRYVEGGMDGNEKSITGCGQLGLAGEGRGGEAVFAQSPIAALKR